MAQGTELRRLMQQLFRRFGALAADATPCGKPLAMAHAHALMILGERGTLSQQALGGELGVDKSNVARLCAKMVDAGHVVQRTGEHDGRSRQVSLTARGEKLAREVEASSKARFRRLLASVPAARRAVVLEGMQYLVDALPKGTE